MKEVFCLFSFNSRLSCLSEESGESWQGERGESESKRERRSRMNKCHCHMSSLPGFLFACFEDATELLT